MLTALRLPTTCIKRCELLGRNIWRFGLMIQAHRLRVEREEAEIADRLKESRKKAAKRKVMSRGKVAKLKQKAWKQRKLEEQDESTCDREQWKVYPYAETLDGRKLG